MGVGYRVEEYFGETYTSPARQEFVFFQGEPISFQMMVGNLGAATATLVIEASDPQRLFQVRAFKAPPLPAEKTADRPLSADRRRFEDEGAVTLPVVFSSPKKTWAGGVFDIQLERETVLDPREYLEWVIRVPSGDLERGYYRVEVRVNGTQGGQPLREFANIRFEVRARTKEDEPELLRREVLRRFSKQDFDGARQAVGDLLRIHPNSGAAYSVLASIADAEGKRDEAATHRRSADAITKAGRDELLLKYAAKGRIID